MGSAERLPVHSTPLWRFEEALAGISRKYIKSYYHRVGTYLPLHMHDFFEINIVFSGSGRHLIGDGNVVTGKGDIFILPPYINHGYSSDGGLVVYHILLSHTFMATFMPFLEKMSGYNMLFNVEPIIRSHMEDARYLRAEDIPYEKTEHFIELIEASGRQPTDELENAPHVLSLIHALSEAYAAMDYLRKEQLRGNRILPMVESMEYVKKHCEQRINFKELAKKSAFSYTTYLRLFKKLTGTTPAEYQLRCRVELAAYMLVRTNETVLSIALACGFYDSSHFIKAFTKNKHQTPAEFRKNNQ